MAYVPLAVALLNLALFGLIAWWMTRVVRALESIEVVAKRVATQPRAVEQPSPTRNILGCLALLAVVSFLSACDACTVAPLYEQRCAAGDAESCIQLQACHQPPNSQLKL